MSRTPHEECTKKVNSQDGLVECILPPNRDYKMTYTCLVSPYDERDERYRIPMKWCIDQVPENFRRQIPLTELVDTKQGTCGIVLGKPNCDPKLVNA